MGRLCGRHHQNVASIERQSGAHIEMSQPWFSDLLPSNKAEDNGGVEFDNIFIKGEHQATQVIFFPSFTEVCCDGKFKKGLEILVGVVEIKNRTSELASNLPSFFPSLPRWMSQTPRFPNLGMTLREPWNAMSRLAVHRMLDLGGVCYFFLQRFRCLLIYLVIMSACNLAIIFMVLCTRVRFIFCKATV